MTLSDEGRRATRAFALLTVLAWLVLHGIPLLAIERLPFDEFFPKANYEIVASASLIVLLLGVYVGGTRHLRASGSLCDGLFKRVLGVCATYLKLTAIPLTGAALYFALHTAELGYGNVDVVPTGFNLLLYVSLTLLPVVLWNRDRMPKTEYVLLLVAVTTPRLVISLTGPRFFVLQALLPIAVWEVTYLGRIPVFRVLASGTLAFMFLFYAAPLLRHDEELGLQHLLGGSPIGLVPQIEQLGLVSPPHSFFVACEIFAGITSVDVCNLRGDLDVPDSVRPRLDQAVTYHIRELTAVDSIGTGGNPLLEAFPDLSLDWNIGWFLLIGLVCGAVLAGMRNAPFLCFIMPHIAAKGLFLWRATISEFFERIPLLVASYAAVIVLARILRGPSCPH